MECKNENKLIASTNDRQYNQINKQKPWTTTCELNSDQFVRNKKTLKIHSHLSIILSSQVTYASI